MLLDALENTKKAEQNAMTEINQMFGTWQANANKAFSGLWLGAVKEEEGPEKAILSIAPPSRFFMPAVSFDAIFPPKRRRSSLGGRCAAHWVSRAECWGLLCTDCCMSGPVFCVTCACFLFLNTLALRCALLHALCVLARLPGR